MIYFKKISRRYTMDKVLNKRMYDFSKHVDTIQTILIYLIALLVPTFLGNILKIFFGATSLVATNSQLIIGTIVNTALIMSALNLKGWKKILGVVTMPSISTILSGYVFSSASPFMVYMIPGIWIGNFALIYAYKSILLSNNKNYLFASVVAVLTKVMIIGAFFATLNFFNVFPEKMVTNLQKAMTITQLITATTGALVSYCIYKTQKNILK